MKHLKLATFACIFLVAFSFSAKAQMDSSQKKISYQLEKDYFDGIRLKNTVFISPILKPKLTISSDWNKSIKPLEWYQNPYYVRKYHRIFSDSAQALGMFLVQCLK